MTFNFSSDLACYSLAKNTNVPTSILDMNHYYSYRHQSNPDVADGAINAAPAVPPANIPSEEEAAATDSLSSVGITPTAATLIKQEIIQQYNNSSKKPSKLDVLIQTATSVDLDSFLPSNNINKNTNIAPNITTNKRKMPSTFNLEYLCNQAEKELNSSALSSLPSLSPAASNLNLRLNLNLKKQKKQQQSSNSNRKLSQSKVKSNQHPKQEPMEQDGNTSGMIATIDDLNNAANPLAIKLASPSTHTKRQRSGPSCDCCRSRKIKCDSEIFILSALDSINLSENVKPKSINSHIAHCDFISCNPKSGYQYYKIIKDQEHALNNKLTSFNYLQFKPCSACITKKLKCCFSKGFTRNDIIKFNKTEKMNSANPGGPNIPIIHSSLSSVNHAFPSTNSNPISVSLSNSNSITNSLQTPNPNPNPDQLSSLHHQHHHHNHLHQNPNSTSLESLNLPSPSASIPASPPSLTTSTTENSTYSASSALTDASSINNEHSAVPIKLENPTSSSLKSSSNIPTPSPTPAGLASSTTSSISEASDVHSSSSSSSIVGENYNQQENDSQEFNQPTFSSENETDNNREIDIDDENNSESITGHVPMRLKDRIMSIIDKDKKSSKKTSCKTCRFKKIKCVKVDGSERCSYCNKKSICCLFE